MASDKDKLMKGAWFLAAAFPFIFGGPTLFYIGSGDVENKYLFITLGIVFMLTAFALGVMGIRKLLSGFFDGDNNNE